MELLVSVVIPFKNRFELVQQALDSVYQQTYKNLEIILIDDGSDHTDYNFKLNPEYQHNLVRQSNKGPATARNAGIQKAKGQYIALLDSDDLFHPDKISKQVQFLQQNPDYALVHTDYGLFKDSVSEVNVVDTSFNKNQAFPKIFLSCRIATPAVLIRSSIAKNYLFDEHLRVGEDTVLWVRIAEKYKIGHIAETLTYVRIHGHNAAFDYKNKFENYKNILQALKKNSVKIPLIYQAFKYLATFLVSQKMLHPIFKK